MRGLGRVIDAQLVLQLLVSGIVLGSRYALIAVSFGIIYSTTQIFHLAHAGTYTIAAYTAIVVANMLGGPLWLALLVGLLVAVLFGALMELGMYRPMRRRNATKLAMFLASLGLSIVVSSLMQIIFGPQNLSLQRVPNATYFLGNVTITSSTSPRSSSVGRRSPCCSSFCGRRSTGERSTRCAPTPRWRWRSASRSIASTCW